MRVRGLKLSILPSRRISSLVAPHAGAWIETMAGSPSAAAPSVAPHAGAWIETLQSDLGNNILKSHPMRVRGLKPLFASLASGAT